MHIDEIRMSPFAQLAALAILTLVLQVPVVMIWGLVGERDRTRDEAVREIASSWGEEQQVVGPYLLVPYRYETVEKNKEGEDYTRSYRAVGVFLAEDLEIDATLKTRTLYRGIFEAPVYQGSIAVRGSFARPDFSDFGQGAREPLWDQAQIVFEISDARGLENAVTVEWGEQSVAFSPGAGALGLDRLGIHASVPMSGEEDGVAFSTHLELKGSSSVRFAPMARDTQVAVSGDWPSPSFQGAWIPTDREVRDDGFTASWSVPHLGRNYPQRWSGVPEQGVVYGSLFGVDLLSPVDAYRQTDRSLKYQILFLGLTFTTIWLFEVLAGARVHWIQYGLIGAALCVFYLLELSLSEHLGFGVAYAIAAGAVLGLITMYARAVLKTTGRTAALAGVVASLYGCLYVLIRLEDYALLTGSIGLFVVLAAIMYLTRNVDWSRPRGAAPAANPSAAQG